MKMNNTTIILIAIVLIVILAGPKLGKIDIEGLFSGFFDGEEVDQTVPVDKRLTVVLMNKYAGAVIGGTPTIDDTTNCEIIDEILSTDTPAHCHDATHCHYASRVTKQIPWTTNGYFFFSTFATANIDAWNVRYTTNASYTNPSFSTSTNLGATWNIDNDNIYDIHMHQFAVGDGINYTINFFDGNATNAQSEPVFDSFDYVNSPPSSLDVINPVNDYTVTINSSGVDVYFSWLEASDADDDIITYKVGISYDGSLNVDENISGVLNDTTLNYTYTFDSINYSHGKYRASVYALDPTSYTLSPQGGVFNLCVNNWVSTEQICIDGVANNTYSDTNNCADEYEKPDSFLTNCQIETGSKASSLLSVWVIIFSILIFLIIMRVHITWFMLGIFVIMFAIFGVGQITDDPSIQVILFILSLFLQAVGMGKMME